MSANVDIYKEQGGSAMKVGSGGSLDIESGGAFKIAGVQMTASAAQINQLADGEVSALVFQGGSATAIAASGAIPITTLYSSLDSSGGALAMTLADGTVGQMKVIKCDTAGNNAVVTPEHFKDGTTITFDAANEVALLVFDGTNWCLIYTDATVA